MKDAGDAEEAKEEYSTLGSEHRRGHPASLHVAALPEAACDGKAMSLHLSFWFASSEAGDVQFLSLECVLSMSTIRRRNRESHHFDEEE